MGKLTMCFTVCMVVIFTIPMAEASSLKDAEKWIEELRHAKHMKVTKLHFYLHDLAKSGKNNKNTTAVMVLPPQPKSSTVFGQINIMDDPLTVEPQISSKLLGYARGFYAGASMEEIGFQMSMSFVFTQEKYNGSSLVVLGYNGPTSKSYHEMPIVGGSGVFRLAQGVVTLRTWFFNPSANNLTLEINAVALHY